MNQYRDLLKLFREYMRHDTIMNVVKSTETIDNDIEHTNETKTKKNQSNEKLFMPWRY